MRFRSTIDSNESLIICDMKPIGPKFHDYMDFSPFEEDI